MSKSWWIVKHFFGGTASGGCLDCNLSISENDASTALIFLFSEAVFIIKSNIMLHQSRHLYIETCAHCVVLVPPLVSLHIVFCAHTQ